MLYTVVFSKHTVSTSIKRKIIWKITGNNKSIIPETYLVHSYNSRDRIHLLELWLQFPEKSDGMLIHQFFCIWIGEDEFYEMKSVVDGGV